MRINRLFPLLDRGQILAHVDATRWDELLPFGLVSVVVDGEAIRLRYSGRLRSGGPNREPVIVLEPVSGSPAALSLLLARLGAPDDAGFLKPADASVEIPAVAATGG